ncbi:hypothetical protein BBF96_09350 [Anoxybacter fermentans]|uniref:DUF4258 domain-containing protein n=1 Tax=Anoxybacter fermentans TaxID=1323375 RepID=A0A3S9SZ32_9FIRM|nr:DUF4258 domain-containing protein [Anoxybacter fermentans]AZR73577.1 hypothetical protein BBF96_09350 [Anoxybacter fermentans]
MNNNYNNYLDNDYSKVEKQIREHQELIITRHFSTRMVERGITYQDLKVSLQNPVVIRHEGSYDHYGNLRIKYTLQSKDRFQEDIGIICALGKEKTVILITVMYFKEEIGWERQPDGLYVKK